MSRHTTDLTGLRFGYLLVERVAAANGRNARWHCRCDCGRVKLVRGDRLRAGDTSSCGCRKQVLHDATVEKRRQRAGASGLIQRKSFDAAWAEACDAALELAALVGPRIRWEGDTTP